VLTVHSFRRLSWPSTIPVGARLFTVGSRLSLPLLSPTTLSALAGWLSRLTALRRRRFAGPLTLWTSHSATATLVTVGIQPMVAFVGPSRSHLAQPFRYALSRVGCWGNVCCPFIMHSSGFILGIANRYHGYNVSLRRCVAVTVYPAVG
jgi:hypothetical protein